MDEYEKDVILTQYNNYLQRIELGIGISNPPWFMVRIEKEIPSNDDNTNWVQKKNKVSKQCKDNDEWVPEKNVKPRFHRTAHICPNCREAFSSKRLYDKHSCDTAAQGIAGRHLMDMNDSDLQEMGIKKGSRLDILRTIKTANNCNKIRIEPANVNSETSRPSQVTSSKKPVSMQGSPTPCGSRSNMQSPGFCPSSPSLSFEHSSPSMLHSNSAERDTPHNLESRKSCQLSYFESRNHSSVYQQHPQASNNESHRPAGFSSLGNETHTFGTPENNLSGRSIQGSRTGMLPPTNGMIPSISRTGCQSPVFSSSTYPNDLNFDPMSNRPGGSISNFFGGPARTSGLPENQFIGQTSSGSRSEMLHPQHPTNRKDPAPFDTSYNLWLTSSTVPCDLSSDSTSQMTENNLGGRSSHGSRTGMLPPNNGMSNRPGGSTSNFFGGPTRTSGLPENQFIGQTSSGSRSEMLHPQPPTNRKDPVPLDTSYNSRSTLSTVPNDLSSHSTSEVPEYQRSGPSGHHAGANLTPRPPPTRRKSPAPVATSSVSSLTSSLVSDLNSEERVNELVQKAAKNLKLGLDILTILRSSRNGTLIANSLETDGFVDDKARKLMASILVNYLNKSGLDANPVLMREEIAILICLNYPKMRKKLTKRLDMPWHHWFNANTNTGFLENANVGYQRSEKKLTGKGTRRSTKTPGAPRLLVELPTNRHDAVDESDPDPPEFTRNVTEARNLLATLNEKPNILDLMQKTFERRRKELEFKELSPAWTLNQYVHFLSFGGEVIEQEFKLMHPNSASLFLRTFSLDYVPKILKLARNEPTKYGELYDYFGDEVLNALLVLGKMLPCPRRTYAHEERQPLHANKADLIHVIPLGCDPKTEADKRRASVNYPLQPHLMIQGHPRALGKMHIVCGNGDLFELPRQASPTNAVDLLFKTYFALHLHYPLGWKNVFRFLQVHVYEIPLGNNRESAFDSVFMKIRNTSL